MSEDYLVRYTPAKRSKSGRTTGWTLAINDHNFAGIYTLKGAQQMVSAYIQKCEGKREA